MKLLRPALAARRIGDVPFDFAQEIAVMGIVNRTPDSFYDRGRTFSLDAAIDAALAAADCGAKIVDIGGVKFAPGPPLPPEDELERVLPVVRALSDNRQVAISVDTFHPLVAERVIEAGASIINDTTGARDPRMMDVVAANGATLLIAHSLAAPRTPYPRPHYEDVVREVADFLRSKVDVAMTRGIPTERVIVDPGHDLNKSTRHSLELTRRFDEFAALGAPTVAAVSRKDFIGESIGAPREDRLEGGIVAATLCVLGGARIIRMHDVAAASRAARMLEVLLGFRDPAYEIHNMGETNSES